MAGAKKGSASTALTLTPQCPLQLFEDHQETQVEFDSLVVEP
jgi:hypothetical protein